ncbi:MAG TPA: hypothetical protein PLX33_10455 [Alphaproteobacteria bacterium]|nr:hypothetical protein [Alphaproteobacteria bacterium]
MDNDVLKQMIDVRRKKYNTTKLTRRIVIELAEFLDMPPMDTVQLLENRGIAPKGSVKWFKWNGGITEKHIEQAKQGLLI